MTTLNDVISKMTLELTSVEEQIQENSYNGIDSPTLYAVKNTLDKYLTQLKQVR